MTLSACLIFNGLTAPNTMALDLSTLWDFKNPAASEQRFRDALGTAQGDDALILRTQMARTLGLRGQFDNARTLLAEMAPQVTQAGAEARARHALELGRTWASAAHPPAALTDAAKAQARAQFEAALATARQAQLDALAIDAIHMMAFVDTAPADQLKWAQAALEVSVASQQPAARQWEASVRNNLGYALHQLGRYPEALAQFELALALRERGTDAVATREARWMIGWTLRSLQRLDEALAVQLRLERECAEAGQPDPYVFEELEALYQAKGDAVRAAHYARRLKPQSSAGPSQAD